MHHFLLLAKRRFRETLSEPQINYLYKAGGFLLMLGSLAAGCVSLVFPALFPVQATVLFVAAAFGAVVLLAGMASSEAWLASMRRRYDYATYGGRQGRKLLGLSALGLLALTLLLVYLVTL